MLFLYSLICLVTECILCIVYFTSLNVIIVVTDLQSNCTSSHMKEGKCYIGKSLWEADVMFWETHGAFTPWCNGAAGAVWRCLHGNNNIINHKDSRVL